MRLRLRLISKRVERDEPVDVFRCCRRTMKRSQRLKRNSADLGNLTVMKFFHRLSAGACSLQIADDSPSQTADFWVMSAAAIFRCWWSPEEKAKRMIWRVSQGDAVPEERSTERIISELLQDFEAGRLTRQQLIHTLALGVTAGPAALAAAQKSAEQSSTPPPRSPAPRKTLAEHRAAALALLEQRKPN
jgi:hypothetical protein